jgi:hypothetical protein
MTGNSWSSGIVTEVGMAKEGYSSDFFLTRSEHKNDLEGLHKPVSGSWGIEPSNFWTKGVCNTWTAVSVWVTVFDFVGSRQRGCLFIFHHALGESFNVARQAWEIGSWRINPIE